MLSERSHWKDNGTGSLNVHVILKASANRVRIEGHTESPFMRADVSVAPNDGAANKRLLSC